MSIQLVLSWSKVIHIRLQFIETTLRLAYEDTPYTNSLGVQFEEVTK